MFKDVPIQAWLLIAVAFAAYVPARYVYRYAAHSPSRRDITQPSEDLSWRTSGKLVRNLAILAAMAAFAIFIFTPTAAAFARSASFFPILITAFGAWSIWAVVQGFSTGLIEPMARGFHNSYERQTQPKRFWASMLWNGCLGLGCLVGGYFAIKDVPVQALKDQCYNAKGALPAKTALAACNQLIATPGKHDEMAVLVAARGSAYYALGDDSHALADYRNAIRLDPHDSSSYYNLGLVHDRLGSRADALADYSAAIREGSANADAYLNRGLIYLDSGKFDEALHDLTRAHELNPTDVGTIASRGVTYAWKKDKDRAERDFAAARAIDPSSPVVMHGEAILAMNDGRFAAAADHLTAAIKRNPPDPWALSMRAEAYKQLGEAEKMRADERSWSD